MTNKKIVSLAFFVVTPVALNLLFRTSFAIEILFSFNSDLVKSYDAISRKHSSCKELINFFNTESFFITTLKLKNP